MGTPFSKAAIEVAKDMMPRDGMAGVDLGSAAFFDIVEDVIEAEDATATLRGIELAEEVTRLLAYIGENGFAILS